MKTDFLALLLEAMPKPIKKSQSPIHHKDKSKGSPLDKYRCEILILRDEFHCSYGEIATWLSDKKQLTISRKSIYLRIKLWTEAKTDDDSKREENARKAREPML